MTRNLLMLSTVIVLARISSSLYLTSKTRVQLLERLGWQKAKVLVAQIPPSVPPVEEIDFLALANVVRPTIQRTTDELGIQLVDFETTLPATREAFPDGLHPTAEIAAQIAKIAFDAIMPHSMGHHNNRGRTVQMPTKLTELFLDTHLTA